MELINNTPIEKYSIAGYPVFVKREDLCCPPPGPPFSKVRGLMPVLKRLKSQGINTVGYTETSISMAGWGVAWACSLLDMKAVIFDPQYKETPGVLKYHRKQWEQFKPDIIPLKAGRAKVNYHISKKILLKKYKNSYLLPLGLILKETIDATEKEAKVSNLKNFNSIIIPVGSGTIAAGILKAISNYNVSVYGICCRETDISMKRNKIIIKGPGMGVCGNNEEKENSNGFNFYPNSDILMDVKKTSKYLNISTTTVSIWSNKGYLKPTMINNRKFYIKKKYPFKFKLIDAGWQYSEPCFLNLPFTSHPYYDIKSIAWMIDNIKKLTPPILFWNIGALPKECYAKVQNLWRIQKIIDGKPFSKTRKYYEGLQIKIPKC